MDNGWGDYSLSNSTNYLSPIFGGFRVSALFSPGGVAGDLSNRKKESVALSYANNSFSAAAVFSRINNPATSIYDEIASPVAGGTCNNPSGYASAGVNHRFGPALFGFTYTNTRFQDVVRRSSILFSGTAAFNNYEALATYNVSPSLLLGASYD